MKATIQMWAAIVLLLFVLALGWYLLSPLFITIETNEESPLQTNTSGTVEITIDNPAMLVSTSPFLASAHDVEGEALLIEEGEDYTIRFENFETVNGPNLHIYLSKDLEGTDYIDLGPIKATSGNVNYDVPVGVNISEYNNVLVWCVPFEVLFSYATL